MTQAEAVTKVKSLQAQGKSIWEIANATSLSQEFVKRIILKSA